ncbi:MAG: TonB-dependent receptor, partial [Betaproteobacteria bacterium]|nr:TonB-dependent receptor [Betaproteobacteria bacterium]
MYGGSAIGGAVNVVSGRIPREPLDGVSGEWVSHFDSASRGTLGGVRVEGGQPGFAYGLELSRQRAGDVRVPGRVIVGDPALRGRVPGSHSDTDEGAMGASWFSDAGFVDVDYHHAEVDSGGAIGTRFANRASEARVDASLSDLLGWRTVVGVAASQRKVAVTGAEALLPVGGASAEGQGLFALTTRQLGAVRVEFGGRIDHEARDGAGLRSRDFTPVTASAAVGWGLASGYVLSFTASRSQRAPGVEELYSRGAHAATATFDVGDPNLGLETARSIELGLRKTEGVWRWSGAVYQTRFQGYVYGALGNLGGVDSAGDLVASGSRGDFTRQDFRAGQAT